MVPEKLTADQIKQKYEKGERDFSNKDVRGQDLSGFNLKDANFHGAYIQGTKFKEAILENADFSYSKAGPPKAWVFGQILATVMSLIIAGYLVGFGATLIGYALNSKHAENVVAGGLSVASVVFCCVIFIALIQQNKLEEAFKWVLFSLMASLLVYLLFAGFIVREAWFSVPFSTLSFIISLACLFTSLIAAALVSAGIVLFKKYLENFPVKMKLEILACVIAFGIGIYVSHLHAGSGSVGFVGNITDINDVSTAAKLATGVALFFSIAVIIMAALIEDKIYKLGGDELSIQIQAIANFALCLGGTDFTKAKLSCANFCCSALAGTSFLPGFGDYNGVRSKYIKWKDSKGLQYCRVGNSALREPRVRKLLVSRNGHGKNYARADLAHMDLDGCDVIGATFADANLTGTHFRGAQLNDSYLIRSFCSNTDFTGADLTGATLESWKVDGETSFSNVKCKFVYLQSEKKERRPCDREKDFSEDEFAALYKKFEHTIDFVFAYGEITAQALKESIDKVNVMYKRANLGIHSIEVGEKDKWIIRLKVAPEADKAKIDSLLRKYINLNKFMTSYRENLKLERRLAQIEYKQQQLIRDLVEAASKPVNNYKMISIIGDVISSIVTAGDMNQVSGSFQQPPSPPSEQANIQDTIRNLVDILRQVNDPRITDIAQTLEAEAQKPSPDTSVVALNLIAGLYRILD